MALMVTVSAHYAANPDEVFRSALRFSEMTQAMRGIATYTGLPASDTAKEADRITVDVTFWGLFTQRGHVMFIERLDPRARIIQSRESGNGIARWDHTLSVQPDGPRARWTDSVIIDAGWRTWFVARFAAFVYTRRHRHRQAQSLACRISAVPQ